MDNQDLEKEKEQAKHDNASQKTAHVAGKATATYFAPGVGGAVYDAASKTKIGQGIENVAGKTLQQVPGLTKAMDKLDDLHALDLADKGLDLVGGSKAAQVAGKAVGGAKATKAGADVGAKVADAGSKSLQNSSKLAEGILLDNKNNAIKLNNTSKNLSSPNSSNTNEQENEGNDNQEDQQDDSKKSNKTLMIVTAIGVPLFLILLMAVVGVASIYYPLEAARNYVTGLWNSFVDWVMPSEQDLEQQYYEELKKVQNDWHEDEGICIDINLITATLTVGRTFDEVLDTGKTEDESGETEQVKDEEGNVIAEIPYKTMKKQVRLLANMQIMTKNYGLNSNLKENTGSYCIDSSKEEYAGYETFQLVDSVTEDYFYDTDFFNRNNGLDSSTYELIAKHDISEFSKFFTKKSSEERNYAYYLFHPSFNTDGTCTDSYAKELLEDLPEDEYEVSIGDYATRRESVYYWNLVNSFILDYYKEYLPEEEPARTAKIHEIADEIYLLYEEIGPSKTCTVAYSGPSALCPNGVTIENVGTLSLEEYVAGVVSREAYTSEGMEALKAQAVAARTYVLNYTDYCTQTIPNSTNAQTFTRDINDRAREAATSTAGEILIYDGNIFSAQYDSFCYDDNDCPDATRNSDGTYSVTYTKVPNGERHTITLSDSDQYNRITHGQGHAHGMSQLLSYQLAKEGKSYEEILSYFYSDGVEISLVLSPSNTDDATIVQGPINNYLTNAGSSIEDINQYIYSQVTRAGVGTRNGVVAAAVSLVSGFYSKTGYKLPYELYPSGKYTGYGMDPSWGTNTGNGSYPLNGLDCSGFISWAIHNGGYEYVVKNAKGWGQAGVSRAWSKGMTDSSAQPGDLIYNAPQSENGTSGHIRMIVDVNNDGYVVAEASGKKNGVRINTISFTSTGSYYLVDMSNYYANATKVTDYPG